MSDTASGLLGLQVQQLLLRVDILERKVAELEQARNHGAHEGFELVSEAAGHTSPARTSSSSSQYNSLALDIDPLPASAVHLCANLKGGKLSFRERAQRAWNAGSWAKFVLQGKISKPRPTTPCELANTTYIVLKAEGISSPVRADKASDYRALVGDFQGESLSHGFASKAEAKVYCQAAGVPFPETVYRWS